MEIISSPEYLGLSRVQGPKNPHGATRWPRKFGAQPGWARAGVWLGFRAYPPPHCPPPAKHTPNGGVVEASLGRSGQGGLGMGVLSSCHLDTSGYGGYDI